MILDVTSGSEARNRLGLQATARVDVHLCRFPHSTSVSLVGSSRPERSWLIRRERRLCCAPERVRWDLRRSHRPASVWCPSGSATRVVVADVEPISFIFDLIRVITCFSSRRN